MIRSLLFVLCLSGTAFAQPAFDSSVDIVEPIYFQTVPFGVDFIDTCEIHVLGWNESPLARDLKLYVWSAPDGLGYGWHEIRSWNIPRGPGKMYLHSHTFVAPLEANIQPYYVFRAVLESNATDEAKTDDATAMPEG